MAKRGMWNRRRKYACTTALIFAFCTAAAFGCWRIRRIYFFPRSDIPVVTSAGFWPYQNALNIEQFDVAIEESRFGFMNTGEALVAMRISGRIELDRGTWQPVIKAVQLTERVVGTDEDRYVDVEIVPIVDEHQIGASASQEFDVKVEHVIHEVKWGENRFVFHCQGQARTVSAFCSK